MHTLLQDLRYAARMLRKSPGFTAVAVLTLALGIGANTAVFSIVSGVLLKPLPYDQPGRLVNLWEQSSAGGFSPVAGGVFLDWQRHSTSFEALSIIWGSDRGDDRNLTGDGNPERIGGWGVSASFLDVLRVRPLLGRGFLPDEDEPGRQNKVVVLSHAMWQRRYGGEKSVVGRTIRLDDESHVIVGVLPPNALLADTIDFLVPFVMRPGEQESGRDVQNFRVIGRLKPDVSPERARAELRSIKERLQPAYPQWKANWGVAILPMHEAATGHVKPMLLVLLGAVGFVLLIACTNTANLLLAKAMARRKEIAVRAALGAGRSRIIRQLLTESLLLALLGGGLGVLLTYWGGDVLSQLAHASLPRANEIGVDARVLLFTLLVSLGTGVLFGVLPAVRSSAPDLNRHLKERDRGSTSGSRGRLQSALIVSQVGLALVLLVGAGLLLRSVVNLLDIPTGFDPKNALAADVWLPPQKYPTGESRTRFLHEVIRRLEALPGVEAAGSATTLPMGWSNASPVRVEGRADQPEHGQGSSCDFVAGSYFRAMGIPLLRGRDFSERDNAANALRVAVVNEALVQKIFRGADPVGERVTFRGEAYEVVGVVGSVRHKGLDGQPDARIYLPQVWFPVSGSLVVRGRIPPLTLAELLRGEVARVDPDQPVSNVRTLAQVIGASIAQRRLTLICLGAFAAVALILSAAGLYGVMTYIVGQRRHEIGVRMALGANRVGVIALVFRRAFLLTLGGLAVGLAGSFALTRFIAAQLYGVHPMDPVTFVSVSLLLLLVALLAACPPARRATRVDPMEALRYE
jgi:predicted permease